MRFSFKLHGRLCFLIGVLVTLSGCDWDFPLTSPSRAKVDTRLIGNWVGITRFPDKDPPESIRSTILSIGAASKLSEYDREKNKIPLGAMILNNVDYRSPGVSDKNGSITIWPTKIGDMQVLNGIPTYSLKKTNHKSAFVISKYEVSGDDLTIYKLQDEKGIKNRLGDSYSSADLFQEISKAQWSRASTFKRIR